MTEQDEAAIRRIVREELHEIHHELTTQLLILFVAIVFVMIIVGAAVTKVHAAPTPTPCYKPGSLQVPCSAPHLTPAEKLKRDRTTLGRVYEGPKPKRVPTTDMRPSRNSHE